MAQAKDDVVLRGDADCELGVRCIPDGLRLGVGADETGLAGAIVGDVVNAGVHRLLLT